MTDTELLKLAKLAGYPDGRVKYLSREDEWDTRVIRRQFDPGFREDDCDKVRQALGRKGWEVEITWQHTSDLELEAVATIHAWNAYTEEHHRLYMDVDDWKQGVCELALKVADND